MTNITLSIAEVILIHSKVEYKGVIYKGEGLIRIKDPITREWLPYVQYVVEGGESTPFARPLREFISRFKRVI